MTLNKAKVILSAVITVLLGTMFYFALYVPVPWMSAVSTLAILTVWGLCISILWGTEGVL